SLDAAESHYATRDQNGTRLAGGLWIGPMAKGSVAVVLMYAPDLVGGAAEALVRQSLGLNRTAGPVLASAPPPPAAPVAPVQAAGPSKLNCPQTLGSLKLGQPPYNPNAEYRIITSAAVVTGIYNHDPWIILGTSQICHYEGPDGLSLMMALSRDRAVAAQNFTKSAVKILPASLGGRTGLRQTWDNKSYED